MPRDELYEEEWIDLYDKIIPETKYRRRVRILFHIINKYIPTARNILEIGCGTARHTKYFANKRRWLKRCFNVVGTDLSAAAISRARKRAKHAKFYVSDMINSHGENEFDVILCLYEVFKYNKNGRACLNTLENAAKALKKGGLFMCDFSIVPKKGNKKVTVRVGKRVEMHGRLIEHEMIFSDGGNFDDREGVIRAYKKRLFRKPILVEEKSIHREPFLRISKHKMIELMEKAGFEIIEVIDHFPPHDSFTHLFVGKKK